MGVFMIPWYVPLIWAVLVTIFWRFKFRDPINHWLVCILIFAVNYLFFSFAFIAFILIAIFEKFIVKRVNKNKE